MAVSAKQQSVLGLWAKVWDDQPDEKGVPTRFSLAWCLKAAPTSPVVFAGLVWSGLVLMASVLAPAVLFIAAGMYVMLALVPIISFILCLFLIAPAAALMAPHLWVTKGVIRHNGDLDFTGRLHPLAMRNADAAQFTRFMGRTVVQEMEDGGPFLGRTLLPQVTSGSYYRAKVKSALSKLGKSRRVNTRSVQLGLLAAIILGSLFLALAAANGAMVTPTPSPSF